MVSGLSRMLTPDSSRRLNYLQRRVYNLSVHQVTSSMIMKLQGEIQGGIVVSNSLDLMLKSTTPNHLKNLSLHWSHRVLNHTTNVVHCRLIQCTPSTDPDSESDIVQAVCRNYLCCIRDRDLKEAHVFGTEYAFSMFEANCSVYSGLPRRRSSGSVGGGCRRYCDLSS